jgi:hypothetical protein
MALFCIFVGQQKTNENTTTDHYSIDNNTVVPQLVVPYRHGNISDSVSHICPHRTITQKTK